MSSQRQRLYPCRVTSAPTTHNGPMSRWSSSVDVYPGYLTKRPSGASLAGDRGSPPLRCFFSRSFQSYGICVVPPRRGIALAPLSGTLLLILFAAKGGLLATSAGPQFVLEVLLFFSLAPSHFSCVAFLELLTLVVPFKFLCFIWAGVVISRVRALPPPLPPPVAGALVLEVPG